MTKSKNIRTAGRPKNSGKYKTPTVPYRIPVVLLKSIQTLIHLFHAQPTKLEEIVETIENSTE